MTTTGLFVGSLIIMSVNQASAMSRCEMIEAQVGDQVEFALNAAEYSVHELKNDEAFIDQCLKAAQANTMIDVSLNVLGKKTRTLSHKVVDLNELKKKYDAFLKKHCSDSRPMPKPAGFSNTGEAGSAVK